MGLARQQQTLVIGVINWIKDFNIISFLQFLSDVAATVLSFILGYWFYVYVLEGSVLYSLSEYLSFSLLAVVVFTVSFRSSRLYQQEISLLNLSETRRLVWCWLFGALIIYTSTFFLRLLDFSRVMVTASMVAALLLFLIERTIFYRIHLRLHSLGFSRRRALIFGAGVVGKNLWKRIFHSPGLGISVKGFLDDDTTLWEKEIYLSETRSSKKVKVLGGLDRLDALADDFLINEIFIAIPNASYDRILDITRVCREKSIRVSIVPPTFGHFMHRLELNEIGGIPIIKEREYKPSIMYLLFKRLLDIVLSVIALFFLSPIILIVTLAIKLDSKGPVLFRQKRIGLNGNEFELLKFRTMYVDAPKYALTPQKSDDPRITRYGKWLRRSSLDEIPQLLNVLWGEMSLVGPRPEMPFIVEKYTEFQRERIKVKPGITGVWQISAVRGEPIHNNIEYDLFYIENRSLLLDFIIMFKTLYGAVRGIGAV